jgi:hypothetical protein
MAEPTPTAAAERPAETLVYRPLSGLAIAGLVCGILYAALVVFSLLFAFFRREPYFLPSWLLALAVAGAALSLVALRQIRNSEGTRAGAALARWGLWLSVLSGLGVGTFAWVSGLAVERQANEFLMEKGKGDRWSGFFPLLLEGDIPAAFLLTEPPRRRLEANPNSLKEMEARFDIPFESRSPKGLLTAFRESDFVRVLQQPYNPRPTVTPLGVKSWGYEGGGYKVVRTYRISTPEGEFDLPVTVQSIDPEAPGEPRRWRVLWGPNMGMTLVKLTPKGKEMDRVRLSAALFANAWLEWLHFRNLPDVYLLTRAPAERKHLQRCRMAQTLAAGSAGLAGAPGGPGFLLSVTGAQVANLLPALEFLAPGKGPVALKPQEFRTPGDGKLKAAVLQALPRDHLGSWPLQQQPKVEEYDVRLARWEVKDGQLELALNVELRVTLPDRQIAVVLGKLVLTADADADPTRAGLETPWRVARLELERAMPIQTPPPKQ